MNVSHDIHHSSQLIYLTISIWSARKLDKEVTRDLNDEKEAASNASRVNKYLMASADDQLKAISRIAREARDLVEKKSLPWDDAGNRLVSNLELFTLLGELGVIEQRFNVAVDAFIAEYPTLMQQSLQALGDMGKPEDYPTAEQVRGKFGMRTSLSPVPAGYDDVRTGLSPEQIRVLNEQYGEQVKAQFVEAQRSAFGQLRADIERVAERLTPTADGKNKQFTYTMVQNLRDTLGLMKGLNIFDNPELTTLANDIEARLCRYDANDLRNSIQAASSTKIAADEVLRKMRSLGL
jgi:hypothetical protein